MKRFFLFIALISLWGCKKAGSDVTPSLDTALVAGSWQLQGLTISPGTSGVWGKNVTNLLAAYRNQIGDACIDEFRMNLTSGGKISRSTSIACSSRTLELFGFTENGTWKAAGTSLSVASPYASGDYTQVTIDQTTMVWHRHQSVADSEDGLTHDVTLTWVRR